MTADRSEIESETPAFSSDLRPGEMRLVLFGLLLGAVAAALTFVAF